MREGRRVVEVDPLRSIRSILVAVDGSDASLNALATACDIARQVKASVSLLHVIEVPRSLALDADLGVEAEHGEDLLARAEEVAGRHKVKIEGQLLQARQAAHAIVDEAVEAGVDVIVLGLSYQRPFGKFQLDEVSEYVLENAPCGVWLFRYPPQEGDGAAGNGGSAS